MFWLKTILETQWKDEEHDVWTNISSLLLVIRRRKRWQDLHGEMWKRCGKAPTVCIQKMWISCPRADVWQSLARCLDLSQESGQIVTFWTGYFRQVLTHQVSASVHGCSRRISLFLHVKLDDALPRCRIPHPTTRTRWLQEGTSWIISHGLCVEFFVHHEVDSRCRWCVLRSRSPVGDDIRKVFPVSDTYQIQSRGIIFDVFLLCKQKSDPEFDSYWCFFFFFFFFVISGTWSQESFFFPFYGHGHMDDWAWDIVYVHVYSEICNKVTKKNRSRGKDVVPDRDVMIFGHNLGIEILELKMYVDRDSSSHTWQQSRSLRNELRKESIFFLDGKTVFMKDTSCNAEWIVIVELLSDWENVQDTRSMNLG